LKGIRAPLSLGSIRLHPSSGDDSGSRRHLHALIERVGLGHRIDRCLVLGTNALNEVVWGSGNTAIGEGAGLKTTGSNNIDIGNQGAAGENGIIRIGTAGTQTDTFIAGIAGVHLTGAAVYVASNGQLGVLASSERYKTSIESLPAANDKLEQLRPVTSQRTSNVNLRRSAV
jgi:hypothetical protein